MAVVTIASAVLRITNGSKNMKENEEIVKEVIRNKKALKKFKDMIKIQYGDINYIDKTSLFEEAKCIVPVYATKSGYVKSLDSAIIGDIARYLGAGRMHNESLIDNTAGIVLKKKAGDVISEKEIIAYIHTNDEKNVHIIIVTCHFLRIIRAGEHLLQSLVALLWCQQGDDWNDDQTANHSDYT